MEKPLKILKFWAWIPGAFLTLTGSKELFYWVTDGDFLCGVRMPPGSTHFAIYTPFYPPLLGAPAKQ
jgi:hypothetical protein